MEEYRSHTMTLAKGKLYAIQGREYDKMGILLETNDYQLVFELILQDQATRNSLPLVPTHWRLTITKTSIGSRWKRERLLTLAEAGICDDSSRLTWKFALLTLSRPREGQT